jgi:hypothetical protein
MTMRPLLLSCLVLYPALARAAVSADWDHRPQGAKWTTTTLQAIEDAGGELLTMPAPKDAADYCPRFGELSRDERKAFFVKLVSAMARYESGFDPGTSYKEKFKDAKGARVVSRGLMQMSVESAKSYGCPVTKAADLHGAEANLQCAVRALGKWIPRDERIGTGRLGGARYWAVLRTSKRKKIQAKTRSLPFCRAVAKAQKSE